MSERPSAETPPEDEFSTHIPQGAAAFSSGDEFATIDTPLGKPPPRTVRYDALVRGDQIGDFLVQRLLGKGSFGAVYLARELSLDRLVALKVVLPAGQDASAGEGRSLARLKHANIVGVYGEAKDKRSQCSLLWMQYVDGCNLATIIDQLRSDKLDETWNQQDLLGMLGSLSSQSDGERESIRSTEAVCRIGQMLAEALDHAHSSGIVHRDIKPANILMDREGTALLADFNLAEDVCTVESSRGGTVAYMAPEQLANLLSTEGYPPVGPRSDLYALGIVLWELSSGKRPHRDAEAQVVAGSGIERLHEFLRIRSEDVPADDQEVPIGLAMVLRRAMMADPSQRFPSAAAMATALRGLSELLGARRRAPMIAGALHYVRRNLFWIILVGGLLPHFAASALQSWYNKIWVLQDLDEDHFMQAFIAYNIVVYPACIGWLAWNLYQFRTGYQRLVQREPIPRGQVRKLRGRLLKLPRQFMIAAAVGWFPGAILFPKLLGWCSGSALSADATFHLFVSFVVAGMIATTYSYAIVLYIVVCHGYRACWQTASHYRDRVRYEFGRAEVRIRRLAILAGILPLAAAATLLAIEIPSIANLPFPTELDQFKADREKIAALIELVIALIVLGAIGLYVVERSSARMIRAVRALTLADE